jgi:hypothetical protein
MVHYKAEKQGWGALEANYPHDPENFAASIADYLEAQCALGWTLLAIHPSDTSSATTFIFTPNAV